MGPREKDNDRLGKRIVKKRRRKEKNSPENKAA